MSRNIVQDNEQNIYFKGTENIFDANLTKKKHFLNWRIFVGILATSLGAALPSGHCLGVINTPQQVMRRWAFLTVFHEYGVNLTENQEATIWGVIVSAYVVGALFGSFLVAPLADSFGRKRTLLLNNFIFIFSGMMIISCSWIRAIEMLIIGRLLSGLATGIGTGLMPLYLSEIAPPSVKGVMGTIFPFGLCTAIFLSQCLGSENILGKEHSWNYLVGGHMFYSLGSLLFYPVLPPSPTHIYLIERNKELALKELTKLRKRDELTALKELSLLTENHVKDSKTEGFRHAFKNPELRRPLQCIIGLSAGQQFVGINAVFYYSTLIFSKAGLSMEQSQMAAMLAGVANLLMSGMALPLVRYFRRKALLVASLTMYLVSLVLLVISLYLLSWFTWASWVAVSSIFMVVLTYGMGLGPIPYMIGTELFSPNARSVGIAIGCASNWGGNLIVGLLFPLMESHMRFYSFIIFFVIGCFFLLFIIFFVPETYHKAEEPSRSCSPSTSSEIFSGSTGSHSPNLPPEDQVAA